jgi:hypothetical protein
MFRTLEPGEGEALQEIAAGLRFGTLCARLVERHGETEGAALAGSWLGQWLKEGLVATVR